MLDLDKYIDNNIEMKINGEIIHVKQPTVAMVDKIDQFEKDITEGNIRSRRIEVAILLLNHNKEERKFKKEDLQSWTQEAIAKVISTMATLRYEAENDPN